MTKSIQRFSGAYRFLSNFYDSEIEVNEKIYPTVEHAYQAHKTLNGKQRELIRLANSPGQAKRLGQKVELRSDWEVVKLSIMKELLTRKFQIPRLRELLLETRDYELIEGNTWGDTYWGVCNGEGQNWLGKLLMEVRNEITGGEEEDGVVYY